MRVGIDLGGTGIKVGLVNEKLEIVKKLSAPTDCRNGYKGVVKDTAKLVLDVVNGAGYKIDDIESIGMGSPGACDSKNGVILFANNLNFHKAPFREEFMKYINKPLLIDNDANCAAYGEYSVFEEKPNVFVAITLGTGVGGGVVIDGKVFRGFNYAGAELGHILLQVDGKQCTCGRRGCFEQYASATALISQTNEAIEKYPDSTLAKMAKADGKVNGKTAFAAYYAGCEVGKQVVEQYIKYLGEGLASIINIFQPKILCIGGGICGEGENLLAPVRKFCSEQTYCKYIEQTEIRIAKLGNNAGIIGAAMLDE